MVEPRYNKQNIEIKMWEESPSKGTGIFLSVTDGFNKRVVIELNVKLLALLLNSLRYYMGTDYKIKVSKNKGG